MPHRRRTATLDHPETKSAVTVPQTTERATYAVTQFFQSKEGASLNGYVRTANDILFNPEDTIERVERTYEEQLEADGEDGSQASLAGERALESIERVSDDLKGRAVRGA